MAMVLYVICIAVVLAVVMIWGWLRWLRSGRPGTLPSMLSLASFVLATISGLVAIASVTYAQLVGDPPVRDPSVLRILFCGELLSLGLSSWPSVECGGPAHCADTR
jgi:hypothetical protein